MTCPGASYIARQPEALVLGGYRGIIDCAINGEGPAGFAAVETLKALHRRTLGEHDARIVIDGLTAFVATLSRCATCPLRAFAPSSSHLCRDEALVLALVAALQHGDETTSHQCARALACPARASEALAAGGEYAMRMRMFGHLLLPVPASALTDILPSRNRQTLFQSTTLH